MGSYSDGEFVFLLQWVTIWTSLTGKYYRTYGGMAGKCMLIGDLVTERLNHKQRRAQRRQQAHEQHQSRKQFEDQGAFSPFGDDNSSCLPLRWGREAFQDGFHNILEMRWEERHTDWIKTIEQLRSRHRIRQWEKRCETMRGVVWLMIALAASASFRVCVWPYSAIFDSLAFAESFRFHHGVPWRRPCW